MMQYHEYRQCDCEWISEIPAHWGTVSIKRTVNSPASSFIDGDWIESDVITSDGIRYLTTGNVGSIDYKEQGSGFISEETFRELNCTEVFPGDILISRLNEPIGRACIVPDLGYRIVVAVDNVIYRPNNELYDNKFLVYQMNCLPYAENANFIARGSTMPRISRTMLGSIKICVPPLIEQKKIASYLDKKCDKINSAIDTQKRKIELLRELKQTIITNAVTRGLNPDAPMKDSGVAWIGKVPEHWEMRKIKNICKSEKYAIKTGPFGTQLKGQELQPDGDIRVYNQRNVIDDQFSQTQFYVSYNKAKELEAFYTKPLDLLVTSRGTIGRCSILPKDQPMGILHPCLIALRLNTQLCDINWVKIYINDSSCFATNIFLNSNATTIEVIYTETLKNITIPIPPIMEQEIIIAHIKKEVSKIEAQISNVNHRIELLNELKQSIITEAVTGKVKVC